MCARRGTASPRSSRASCRPTADAGTDLSAHALRRADPLGATAIETCVLASNEDGLRYARAHGFTEIDRYVLPGSTIPWVDPRRK